MSRALIALLIFGWIFQGAVASIRHRLERTIMHWIEIWNTLVAWLTAPVIAGLWFYWETHKSDATNETTGR